MIKEFKLWINQRRNYRQTFRALNALTDYELNDLGLCRGMINDIALEAIYGKEIIRD